MYSKVFVDSIPNSSNYIIYKDNHLFTTQYYETSDTNIDIRLLKIDTLGNIINEWLYGGIDTEIGYAFEETNDNGFIIAGSSRSYSVAGNSDFLFIKLDSLGNVEWQNTYGTANDETVRSYNYLTTTKDGGYAMLGEELFSTVFDTYVETVVLKVDSTGIEQWRKNISSYKFTSGKSLREWQDGTLIFTGGTFDQNTTAPFNTTRSYLIKLSSDGETEIWRRYYSKNWIQSHEYINGMMLTSDGGILTTGYIAGVSATLNDAWAVKFDSCGYTVGDVPEPMLIIDSIVGKTVHITDQSQNYCTAALDWGDGTELKPYYAYENNLPLAEKHFSHTYSQTGDITIRTTALAGEEFRAYEVQVMGLSNHSIGAVIPAQAGISLFPNPANDYVIVQNPYSTYAVDSFLQRNDDSFKMTIHSLNGKQVESINLNPKLYQQKIDVSAFNNGVYFVRFMIGDELIGTEKLVVAR